MTKQETAEKLEYFYRIYEALYKVHWQQIEGASETKPSHIWLMKQTFQHLPLEKQKELAAWRP